MKKIIKWLDNFWYHYKWPTIMIAFFGTILVVGIVQMVGKTDPDISLIYAGPQVITEQGSQEMEKTFSQVVREDINDDGEKVVRLTEVVILSDAQLQEKKEEAEEEGDALYYDVSLRDDAFNQAKGWLVTGEMLVCLMDPYVYEIFAKQNLFLPLADYLDEVPDFAYDAYSIRFSETEFGSFYSSLEPLGEDTLLCLVKPTFLGTDEESARYQAHIAFIKEILAFEIE